MAIKGNEADELVAARSDVCTFIQFRENNHYDDPPLESIKLEPGKPVPMRPTATHLRLGGMRRPLKLATISISFSISSMRAKLKSRSLSRKSPASEYLSLLQKLGSSGP